MNLDADRSTTKTTGSGRWRHSHQLLLAIAAAQLLYWLVIAPALVVERRDLNMIKVYGSEAATLSELGDPPQTAAVELPWQDCCEPGYRFLRGKFDLPAIPDEGLAIVPIVGSDNYRLTVNGNPIFAMGRMQLPDITFHGNVRAVFRIQRDALRLGENQFELRMVRDSGSPSFFVAAPILGDYVEMVDAYRIRSFLLNGYNVVSMTIGLTLLILTLIVLWRSEHRGFLTWLAILFAAWSLRLVYYDMTDPPLRGNHRIVALYLLVNLLPVAWFNLMNHWSAQRLPYLTRVSLLVYALLSMLVTAILYGRWYAHIDTADTLSTWFGLLLSAATLALLLRQLPRLQPDRALETAVFALCVSLIVVDAISGLSGSNVSHIARAMPLLLLGLAAAFLARNVQLFRSSAQISRLLAGQLAEREQELSAAHARQRELVRQQAHDDERRRIMRDMHDGVGSQLMSMLLASRRGTLDAEAVSGGLQSVVDEMRLMIDSMDSVGESLGIALATFRERTQSRVERAGFRFHWRQDGPVAMPGYGPHDVLQVFRILQEAVNNTLRHSGGSRVEIDIQSIDEGLQIRLLDDGRGLPEQPVNGRGLGNMQTRARNTGASLTLQSTQTGLSVLLTLPPKSAGESL